MFKFRIVFMLLFVWMVACTSSTPQGGSVATEPTRLPETAVPIPTTNPISAIDQLATLLTTAGANVVNNGRIQQGLFPGTNAILWRLSVDGVIVNAFEFTNIDGTNIIIK